VGEFGDEVAVVAAYLHKDQDVAWALRSRPLEDCKDLGRIRLDASLRHPLTSPDHLGSEDERRLSSEREEEFSRAMKHLAKCDEQFGRVPRAAGAKSSNQLESSSRMSC
jgi:hypothetical protein